MPRKAQPSAALEERCINRVTSERTVQFFGDGVHRFFLEQRCTDYKAVGSEICHLCSQPNTSKKQYTRTFPRGRVNEPLPADSHLFDSEWYHRRAKEWGYPPAEVVLRAVQSQEEARKDFAVASKVSDPISSSSLMPPRRKPTPVAPPPASVAPVAPPPASVAPAPVAPEEVVVLTDPSIEQKKVRKTRIPKKAPEAAPEAAPVEPAGAAKDSKNVPKRTRKPRIVAPFLPMEPVETEEPSVLSIQSHSEEKEALLLQSASEPAKRKVKRTVKKKTEPIVHPQSTTHKDTCIPTHLEEDLEEYSISDYETEVVTLSVFRLEDTTYFRDTKKNKLYRRIKEKTIGPYVGRYDPMTDSVVTDVPDSDDECE